MEKDNTQGISGNHKMFFEYQKGSVDGMKANYTIPNVTYFECDPDSNKVTIKFTTEQGSTKTVVEQYNSLLSLTLR